MFYWRFLAAVPQQNFLGVLIDDSKSMTIADRDEKPRTAFVQDQFGQPDSPLLKAELNEFLAKHPPGSATRNILLQRYLKNARFVKNAATEEERKKFDETLTPEQREQMLLQLLDTTHSLLTSVRLARLRRTGQARVGDMAAQAGG